MAENLPRLRRNVRALLLELLLVVAVVLGAGALAAAAITLLVLLGRLAARALKWLVT